jgi:hypothetical protein
MEIIFFYVVGVFWVAHHTLSMAMKQVRPGDSMIGPQL